MKYLLSALLILIFASCKQSPEFKPIQFKSVQIEPVLQDSTLSIRAIEILDDGNLAFAANNGAYGLYDVKKQLWQTAVQNYDSLTLQFRAVAHTKTDFFMLSIDTPGLLYKTGDSGRMELVYKEEGQGVFYDAMDFWNDQEGMAIGDSIGGCISIIITRNGGATWNKLDCEDLPEGLPEEGAFAASNTNIAIVGDKTWVATNTGRIYYSADKGQSWQVSDTPIIKAKPTEGIYSLAFYDAENGFAIGGDYTNPEAHSKNKIRTRDGGKTWELVAVGQNPGYRSCVQYFPNSGGKGLVVVGFNGIDLSADAGNTWKHLSDTGFYTLRFINDHEAFAAGQGGISKLIFKE
ncbi:oxidoreductase [Gaetbulibacter sp. M240]|uniref:WD40/YVTN/BNR-like repeat-containing protein n=1 Tax=Gaetbulibacter sp. M240 TaxID=3126511 RepID=UPI00374F1578